MALIEFFKQRVKELEELLKNNTKSSSSVRHSLKVNRLLLEEMYRRQEVYRRQEENLNVKSNNK